ncbi:MAG TPA: 3-deoxy-7-phosphoheptulonate synthase [Candidatus Dormibacteraeota bacterium]|nr:3-deoxy-7-phosphoheptulonate synthase [Candidatus Dormibacteraeota bacterium]
MTQPNTPPITNILDEAGRIKSALLKIQAKVEAAASTAEAELLKDCQSELGYNLEEAAPSAPQALINTRIAAVTPVITPQMLAAVLPVSDNSAHTTGQSRQTIVDILDHRTPKLLVIVGPCSIHDPKGALEYAGHVRRWREQYGDNLEIIMRAYMEKPRTELGWKGFIYDPLLDESDDINLGIVATRLLACQITDLGVPIAMERLNALTPQYVNALVAYDTIGARNTTDQKSREYASGTSSPVGFKNTPEGSIEAAVQAVVSAKGGHAFLGMGMNGAPTQVNSIGNETAHVILRGDAHGPNYSADHIAKTKQILLAKGLSPSIIVDASHGNSGKQADRQKIAVTDVSHQIAGGEAAICGVMIESNLVAGRQKLGDPADLVYGQSITDACVGLDETEAMLAELAEASARRSVAQNQ